MDHSPDPSIGTLFLARSLGPKVTVANTYIWQFFLKMIIIVKYEYMRIHQYYDNPSNHLSNKSINKSIKQSIKQLINQ